MSVRSEKRPFLRSLLALGTLALTFGSLGLGMSAFTAFADDELAGTPSITASVSTGHVSNGTVQLTVTAANPSGESLVNPAVCVAISGTDTAAGQDSEEVESDSVPESNASAALLETPSVPEGWTVKYSTDLDACQPTPHTEDAAADTPEGTLIDAPAGTPVLWSDSLPEDLAAVKAVEVQAPLLAEGDSASITYKMILPKLADYADQVFWWNPILFYQETSETSRVAVVGEAVGVGAVGGTAEPSVAPGEVGNPVVSKDCSEEQDCQSEVAANQNPVVALALPLVKMQEAPQTQEKPADAAVISIQDVGGKPVKKASIGQKLIASPKDWPTNTEFTLQWYVVDPSSDQRTTIKGATDVTLIVSQDWAGKNIEVDATGTVNGEVYAKVTSNPVAVADQAAAPVKQNNASVGSLAKTGAAGLLGLPAALSMFGLGAAAYAVRCRRS